MTTFYRIYDVMCGTGILVNVETFRSIKETLCGHWVVSQFGPDWMTPEELIKRKFARWVSNTAVRRYCYPTIEQAIHSFKKRKESQAIRLSSQLQQAELILRNKGAWESADLQKLKASINLGRTEAMRGMIWEW